MSTKVLQILTDRVTAMLKDGKVPWRKPWNTSGVQPTNIDGWQYKGINVFLLGMQPFAVPVFLTFHQIKAKGGTIKAGEEKKHSPVFFWKVLDVTKDRHGNKLDDPRKIPFTRYSSVWNIEQVEGIKLPKRFQPKDDGKVFNAIEAAEAIVSGYNGPEVIHGGDRACYNPNLDKVTMPKKEQFHSEAEYYSTLFHEYTHSTGHKTRLNRKDGMENISFGSHNYSKEELIAEMGAAMLCSHSGIDNTLDNSAAYIAGWLEKLDKDPALLMVAAGAAQKAFKHIAPQFSAEVAETEETAPVAEAA